MSSVAVVAHAGKSIGGGLRELRTALEREGVTDPIWFEVDKSKRAPRFVRQAVERVWQLLWAIRIALVLVRLSLA